MTFLENEMTYFKNRSIPLYYQLENILREKITSGEYRPGDPIQTEDQLVRSYQVSRITVRKALSGLEKDGLIIRKRHIGSFVTKKLITLEPVKLTGEIEDIIARGTKTNSRVIGFDFVHPPQKVIEMLKLDEHSRPLKIERIRLVKGLPLLYSINYIPPDLGEKIREKDVSYHPIYYTLENKCKEKIGGGTQTVGATIADSRIASLLGVMTGAPLLKIERIAFNTRGRPLNYVTILYRADRYHYTVHLIRGSRKSRNQWNYNNP